MASKSTTSIIITNPQKLVIVIVIRPLFFYLPNIFFNMYKSKLLTTYFTPKRI